MLGELEQIVLLAVMRLSVNGYGVTIRDEIARLTGRRLTLGTLHKTLVRLEAKGLVASRVGEAAPYRGGRRKRHYRVTAAGQELVRDSLAALQRMADGLEIGLEPT